MIYQTIECLRNLQDTDCPFLPLKKAQTLTQPPMSSESPYRLDGVLASLLGVILICLLI